MLCSFMGVGMCNYLAMHITSIGDLHTPQFHILVRVNIQVSIHASACQTSCICVGMCKNLTLHVSHLHTTTLPSSISVPSTTVCCPVLSCVDLKKNATRTAQCGGFTLSLVLKALLRISVPPLVWQNGSSLFYNEKHIFDMVSPAVANRTGSCACLIQVHAREYCCIQ